MSGSAWVMGIAIGAYEWMAAITLVIVGKWLLPVFLKHKIYTMPQFLEQRYDHRVRMVMAFFWLGVYVFVNLTSILWLGAQAVTTVTGAELMWGLVGLGLLRNQPWLDLVFRGRRQERLRTVPGRGRQCLQQLQRRHRPGHRRTGGDDQHQQRGSLRDLNIGNACPFGRGYGFWS